MRHQLILFTTFCVASGQIHSSVNEMEREEGQSSHKFETKRLQATWACLLGATNACNEGTTKRHFVRFVYCRAVEWVIT
jgi:hypothetical protein